ncbi:nuclease, partial [Plesiomonas shigelloides]
VLLSDVEVSDYIKRIKDIKLTPGRVTDYMHKKHVKELVSAKENYAGDVCPKCGSALILRESRRGKNVGSKFWGCSQYPKCRTVIKSN